MGRRIRIGYDVRPFLRQETGVGVYFKNLLFALAGMDRENDYYLLSSSLKDRFEQDKIPPFRRLHFRDLRWPVKMVNFFWYGLGWPPLDWFFKTDLDLTHSPGPLPLPTRGKKVVTVHDVFFLDDPARVDRETRQYFVRRVARSLRHSHGIVTVSRSVRDQVMEMFGPAEEKVRVIYHGLDRQFTAPVYAEDKESVRRRYRLEQPFLLFVGATEPRKNLVRLVEAFAILSGWDEGVALVIVGRPGQEEGRLKDQVVQRGLEGRVRRIGYVDEKDLVVLYRLAELFVFPSLAEGFGFPLLEAMACGLPIAASRAPAIPEVAGKAAVYFAPEDPEEMASTIARALTDQDLRQTLVNAGRDRIQDFDWTQTAAQTLNFYRWVLRDE